MLSLGWTECDVVRLTINDDDARKLAIRLNRSAELAAWDRPKLSAHLQKIKAGGIDLDDIGFSNDEADDIRKQLSAETEPTPPASDPKPPHQRKNTVPEMRASIHRLTERPMAKTKPIAAGNLTVVRWKLSRQGSPGKCPDSRPTQSDHNHG